ncbi:MAG: heme ABC exporter ATP-binding protein CcmA [Candidatus Methylomirabilales bacterium]
MGSSAWAVEVQGLKKAFGSTLALKGVDLKLPRGRLLVLFGPNGAGKTTLLKVLATLIRPTSGDGKVLGFDLLKEGEEIRKRIGVLAHGSYLYEDLTALENLKFYAAMRGIDGGRERLLQALEEVDLDGCATLRVRTFSLGMKRRLALSRFLLDEPELLLLDEPFAGLDQQAMKRLERLLVGWKERGQSMIMATHSLRRGYDLSDQIAILNKGKLVFEAEKDGITFGDLQSLYDASMGEA